MENELKINGIDNLTFDENGLIPAVVQDRQTGKVLMLAYMNRESLQLSLEGGETWFYSRSRQELWHKGETSGNTQEIISISYDCDGDTLLVEVIPRGPACHTGEVSCFYRQLMEPESKVNREIIKDLFNLIQARRSNPEEGSYTNYLFQEGIDKILKKVGEETAEVIIAAKNPVKEELVYELSDLTYHLLVLMAELDCSPEEIRAELTRRHKT